MSETTMTPSIPTKPNKANLIRALLKQKRKPKDIAAEVGCKIQYVYSVQNYDRVKAVKTKNRVKYERKKAIVAGAVKRKYTKSGKYAKKVKAKASPAPMVESVVGEVRYVQVDVPQPHYDLTWKQRFTALFFGRV